MNNSVYFFRLINSASSSVWRKSSSFINKLTWKAKRLLLWSCSFLTYGWTWRSWDTSLKLQVGFWSTNIRQTPIPSSQTSINIYLLLFWLFRPWTRASKSQRAAPGACCEKQLEGSSQSSGWGTDSPFSGSWTSNEEELHFSLSAEIQLSETFFLFLNWAKSSLYIKCAFAVKNLQQIKWLRTT